MSRRVRVSVRLRLTLSYATFLMIAGALLLAVVYVFLLRYVPLGSHRILGVPGGGPYRIDLIRAFVPPAIAALVFLLVLGLLGGWLLAGWMLAPLRKITTATRRVASGALSHRIELEGRNDEFGELADSFDAMVARLEAHDAEQRRFAANASHELRTPLAISQAMIDVALRDPDTDATELLHQLRAVNTRSIELTEAMLLLSRIEQRSFLREPVDLSLLAEEAAETLLPLAEERAVSVDVSGAASITVGSHALLLQVVTNLIHNAIVHNLPEHGTVDVSATTGHDAVLVVENSGPTIPPQLVATLTEPFQRGTARIRGHESGVGLGLAIVKSIVEAHDGTLSLEPGHGGGLKVTVRLPAVPADPSNWR
jgi:two-component system sensor histidine kinase VanS